MLRSSWISTIVIDDKTSRFHTIYLLDQILKQLLNIATAMDVLGAPSTLTRELERGVEKLIFKGNVTGFLSSLSHGVTNSVSKVSSPCFKYSKLF